MDNGDRQMTLTTITIHHTHDPDVINETLIDNPDFQIDLNSSPYKTPITAPKRSLIPFLLDYYYWDHDQVTLNHPQIIQSDIDSYIRSKMN